MFMILNNRRQFTKLILNNLLDYLELSMLLRKFHKGSM